jgi:hypothetical protein
MATVIGEVQGGEFNNDPKGVRTTTRRWLVAGTTADTEQTAVAAVPVNRYDHHPIDYGMLALEGSAKPVDDKGLGMFIVSIKYTSKPFDEKNSGDQPEKNSNDTQPDQRPYLVGMHAVHRDKVLGPQDLDVPPKDVKNTAGDVFDPPIMRPSSNIMVTITGYKAIGAVGPLQKINAYMNTVNDADYPLPTPGQKILAKQGRVNDFSWEQVFEQGSYWWKFKLDIEVNVDGWGVRVANLGMNKKISNALPLQRIVINGVPVARPVPLKADGSGPLNAGDDINFCDFKAYAEKDWSVII